MPAVRLGVALLACVLLPAAHGAELKLELEPPNNLRAAAKVVNESTSLPVQKLDRIFVEGRVEPEDFQRAAKTPLQKLRAALEKSAPTRGTTVAESATASGGRVTKITTPGRTYWIEHRPGQIDAAGMGAGGVAMNCYGGCR